MGDNEYQEQEERNQELLNNQVQESDMGSSAQKIEFAKAMSKFQGEITGAKKDSDNPFFKSSYADLASCWDAIRKPLADNGLSIMQMPQGGTGEVVTLETIILHSSGHSESCVMSMKPTKNDPQGLGSCLTYLRRYMLSAVTGLAQVDDDGNDASNGGKKSTNMASEKQVKFVRDLVQQKWNVEDFRAKFGVMSAEELTSSQAKEAIDFINNQVKPQGAE